MDKTISKDDIKKILKENLTIQVKNWQFHSDIIVKFDGEVITKAKIDS
jgi:tRNA A37 methylthiotransferase MiaB